LEQWPGLKLRRSLPRLFLHTHRAPQPRAINNCEFVPLVHPWYRRHLPCPCAPALAPGARTSCARTLCAHYSGSGSKGRARQDGRLPNQRLVSRPHHDKALEPGAQLRGSLRDSQVGIQITGPQCGSHEGQGRPRLHGLQSRGPEPPRPRHCRLPAPLAMPVGQARRARVLQAALGQPGPSLDRSPEGCAAGAAPGGALGVRGRQLARVPKGLCLPARELRAAQGEATGCRRPGGSPAVRPGLPLPLLPLRRGQSPRTIQRHHRGTGRGRLRPRGKLKRPSPRHAQHSLAVPPGPAAAGEGRCCLRQCRPQVPMFLQQGMNPKKQHEIREAGAAHQPGARAARAPRTSWSAGARPGLAAQVLCFTFGLPVVALEGEGHNSTVASNRSRKAKAVISRKDGPQKKGEPLQPPQLLHSAQSEDHTLAPEAQQPGVTIGSSCGEGWEAAHGRTQRKPVWPPPAASGTQGQRPGSPRL